MNAFWRYLRLLVRMTGGLILVLFAGFFVHWLVIAGAFDGPFRNPYEADDICFTQDWPGATSRYVEWWSWVLRCRTYRPRYLPCVRHEGARNEA